MKFEPIAQFIRRNPNIILTAHETPDGDALGAEYALYSALRELGKQIRIINSDAASHKFQFLDMERVIESIEEGAKLPENLADWALIILDTNDIHNIGEMSELVLPFVKEYFILDHHEREGDVVTGNLVVEDASSTCEVVYELIKELDVQIDYPAAQAIYTGIIYDTGSFIYPKTSPKTFKIAHHLSSIGVQPNSIYSAVYESNSISSLKMQSKVLSTLELKLNHRVAIQKMLKETIQECGGSYEESDTFINTPLKSERIRVSVFFKENENGLLRCSLRSKGNINVADIAQQFGGGGHKTAAGFKCTSSLEETQKKVLDMLSVYFE
jgi:phosphoesterase RecJ-like protein